MGQRLWQRPGDHDLRRLHHTLRGDLRAEVAIRLGPRPRARHPHDTPVEIGGDGFIPGFAEQLEGARPGESRTINVTFPENYGKADLAGKAATFDITVKQLSTQTVPEADDDLAKKLGATDMAAVREMITSRQQQELDGMSRMRLKKSLLDELAKTADFPVPDLSGELRCPTTTRRRPVSKIPFARSVTWLRHGIHCGT